MPISLGGTCHANPERIVAALNELADLVREQNTLLTKLLCKSEGVESFSVDTGDDGQVMEVGNTDPTASTAPSALRSED